jgi:hypothetical protein
VSDSSNDRLFLALSAVFVVAICVAFSAPARSARVAPTRGLVTNVSRQLAQAVTPSPIPVPTITLGSSNFAAGVPIAWLNVNDEQLSVIKTNGTFQAWVAGRIPNFTYRGTTGLLAAAALPTFSAASGVTEPIFGPSPSPSPTFGFEVNYAAPGSVLLLHTPAPAVTPLYAMLYEGENWFFCMTYDSSCDATSGVPFWGSVGWASSTDGQNWVNPTRVISSEETKPTASPSPAVGYGNFVPSAIATNGHLYVFYTNGLLTDPMEGRIQVARAPIPAVNVTTPPTFHKWFVKLGVGGFTENGVGGDNSPIIPVHDSGHLTVPCGVPQHEPGISYMQTFGVYFMTMICDYWSGGSDLGPRWFYSTSFDLDTEVWTTPVVIAPNDIKTDTLGNFYFHPTFVSSDQSSQQIIDQTGYVYFSFGPEFGTARVMDYRTFCITNADHPTC